MISVKKKRVENCSRNEETIIRASTCILRLFFVHCRSKNDFFFDQSGPGAIAINLAGKAMIIRSAKFSLGNDAIIRSTDQKRTKNKNHAGKFLIQLIDLLVNSFANQGNELIGKLENEGIVDRDTAIIHQFENFRNSKTGNRDWDS